MTQSDTTNGLTQMSDMMDELVPCAMNIVFAEFNSAKMY
jgi:hypothetical protein